MLTQPETSGAKCSIFSPSAGFRPLRSWRLPRPTRSARSLSATRFLKCKALENFDFSGTDICLMSAGGTVSKEWAPKIAGQGCIVVDEFLRLALRFRRASDRCPEVNTGSIAISPNATSLQIRIVRRVQLVVALENPARQGQDQASSLRPINRYPAPARRPWTSCFPRPASDLRVRSVTTKKFPKRIAFNVIPEIDVFMEDGYTKEDGDDGDEEDPRPQDQAHRDLRAGAGLHQPHARRSTSSSPTR